MTADLCIVGAGAAGLAIALELIDAPVRVLLLERGGVTGGNGDDGIYRVAAGAPPRLVLDPEALRYVGGSTNHWLGNCRPLDEEDFAARDWIPGSGWPIRRDELAPFYERAQELCGLGGLGLYDLEACRPHLAHPPLEVEPRILVNRVLQTCPEPRLAGLHGPRLREADNLRVLAGARVTHFETTASGDTVVQLHAVTAGKRPLRVAARAFVLAAGGVDNARLLLGSAGPTHPTGLGNRHDLIGRYFMEHAYVDVPIAPWGEKRDLHFYTGRQSVGAALIWGQLSLSQAFMRAERAPGLTLWFQRHSSMAPGVVAASRLKGMVMGRARPAMPFRDLLTVLRRPGEVWRAARERRGAPGNALAVRIQMEQTPRPWNRVALGRARDRHGQQRAELTLRLTDDEPQHIRSLTMAAEAIGLEGRRLAAIVQAMVRAGDVGFFSHHMGTTRMGEGPTEGVVDREGRVFGLSNLFVAGSSVFPTGGTAGPTLTIVALALRLAHHLRQRHW